ncbi:MAG: RNA polymerase subunit sigma-24 [Candidatus Omnitrophica bacterium CG07_land_8_20_14_0_80_42_15]|uniref:RNA polymerase sigma factor n=1 Tax=Candidatus Aquitaenariimonas noxiae TaxID=1974741 RepID=A0A2J0KV10_9BACT|nr:MAG: RNA polymerase subunit sigma-24 [Candidatus Omnitrophica bacterium CG07_land_8_20_14_0_80_42_15]
MQPSDEYLIQKAREEDRSTFEELYNRYKKAIFGYIYRLIGDKAVAEELTQETFVKVYMNLARYRPEGKVSSWIYTIAGNLAKNELRSRGYRKTVSLEVTVSDDERITIGDMLADESFKPDDITQNEELKQDIQKAIQMLPVKYREVLILCDVQSLSYDSVAEIIGSTIGTVASRLSRARAAFVKIFRENFGDRT